MEILMAVVLARWTDNAFTLTGWGFITLFAVICASGISHGWWWQR